MLQAVLLKYRYDTKNEHLGLLFANNAVNLFLVLGLVLSLIKQSPMF
jgi:hypothetical protein